jgi:predicted dehydrogenase
MNEKLRCAVIGLGGRGQHLLRQALKNPHYEVVALAEQNPELLGKARAMTELAPDACYADLEPAMSMPDVEACIINTPPQLHAAHLKASFAHNLPAFIAKPLTRDLAQAREVVEIAEAKNLVLLVDQQQRFRPVERAVAQWIAEEKYGELGFGTYTFHRNRPEMHNSTDEDPFLWEQGVHCFDSLLAMLGRRALTVRSTQMQPSWSRYNGPTVIMGVIEFEGATPAAPAVPIQFFGSYASRVRAIELRLEFEKAAVQIEETVPPRLLVAGEDKNFETVDLSHMEERCGEQWNLDNFYHAVRKGGRVPNDGRENLRALAVIDAFIRSRRDNREVAVTDVG